MSIQKIIKFYTFKPQPSMWNLNWGQTNIESIDLLKKIFSSNESYSFSNDEGKFNIDIIEIGSSFIFGTCSKENEVTYNQFLQMRDIKTNTTTPYKSAQPDKQLEVYTYFYIDTTQNRMAVISQKSIAKIHCILDEFIIKESSNQLFYYIVPEKIDDVKKAAKQLQRTKYLELSFAKGKSKYIVEPLVKSIGDFECESYSVSLKISQSNDSFINKIFSLSTEEKDNFNGIKLIGSNEYGLNETINFLETYYTKNTPFDLSDDVATNTEYIKNKLSSALSR